MVSADQLKMVTRWFLYLLIGSIGVGTVLAIVIVLAGNWGWIETRILLTTGVIALTSVLGMACGAAISRLRSWWLPGIGIGLAVLAAALLIIGIWVEPTDGAYWKATTSVSILAVAFAHTSLLALARLQDSLRWIQLAAYGAVFLFALMLIGILITETSNDGVVRALAVVGILDAAFTLLVPVVHFLSRRAPGGATEPMVDVAVIDAEIASLQARIAELEAAREATAKPA